MILTEHITFVTQYQTKQNSIFSFFDKEVFHHWMHLTHTEGHSKRIYLFIGRLHLKSIHYADDRFKRKIKTELSGNVVKHVKDRIHSCQQKGQAKFCVIHQGYQNQCG